VEQGGGVCRGSRKNKGGGVSFSKIEYLMCRLVIIRVLVLLLLIRWGAQMVGSVNSVYHKFGGPIKSSSNLSMAILPGILWAELIVSLGISSK